MIFILNYDILKSDARWQIGIRDKHEQFKETRDLFTYIDPLSSQFQF